MTKLTFDAWKAEVDAAIVKKVGLSADDLPDFAYLDAFEDRTPPATAAARAIKAAKEF